MSESQIVLNEAVVFFNGNKVAKTMLYSEFESVLDGMTGIQDYAGENVKAAYVTIDNGLCVRSCAFFKLSFSIDGLADRHWNVPLRHLADVAGPGPDMGAGRINLACKSQCPVAWHTEQLWDPDMSSTSNHLSVLKKVIKTNPMQFAIYEDSAEDESSANSHGAQANDSAYSPKRDELQSPKFDNTKPTVSRNTESNHSSAPSIPSVPRINNIISEERADSQVSSVTSDERIRLARTIKKQRLHINILKTGKEEEITKLKFQLQTKDLENKNELTTAQARIDVLLAQRDALKEQIKSQSSRIESHELVANDRLRIADDDKKYQLDSLKSQLEKQFNLKQEEQKDRFNEQLQIKDIELTRVNETSKQMESALAKLRNQKHDSSAIDLISANKDEEIASLKFQLKTRDLESEKVLRDLRGQFEVLTAQDESLKEQIKSLKSRIETQNLAAIDRLKIANEDKDNQLDLQKFQLEEQFKLKEDEQIAQLNEQLQLKEMDLMYRNEISEQMEKELTQLRNQKVNMLDSSDDSILKKMQDLGLNFIAFHPGAGHISIPLGDMSEYMNNAMEYIAAKCYVTEIQYKLWLSHYENPTCMYHSVSGDQCTKRIAMTSLPSKFIEGESDRCQDHKLSGQNTNVSIFAQRS